MMTATAPVPASPMWGTPYALLTPRQKRKRAAEAKGKYLERIIRGHLERNGWTVETANKVLKRYFNRKTGLWARTSARHDFFNVWDGIGVSPEREVTFYQVTTLTNIAHKRAKIRRAKFPCSPRDRIYAYVGRPSRWRILVGPAFSIHGDDVRIRVPKLVPVNGHGGAT